MVGRPRDIPGVQLLCNKMENIHLRAGKVFNRNWRSVQNMVSNILIIHKFIKFMKDYINLMNQKLSQYYEKELLRCLSSDNSNESNHIHIRYNQNMRDNINYSPLVYFSARGCGIRSQKNCLHRS